MSGTTLNGPPQDFRKTWCPEKIDAFQFFSISAKPNLKKNTFLLKCSETDSYIKYLYVIGMNQLIAKYF